MFGGDMIRSDRVAHAVISARLLADLMTKLETIPIAAPPLPNPVWVRWDFEGALFPPHFAELDRTAAAQPLPGWLVAVTVRVRERIARSQNLQPVLGHVDWEAQNLRWIGENSHAVHDWDSLAWLPEAAVVGAASGAFASEGESVSGQSTLMGSSRWRGESSPRSLKRDPAIANRAM
jgi:hypothetical protein